MTASPRSFDASSVVVVPSRPGPVRRLDAADRGRDDVDDLLDDLFGQPDERGPSVVDAVLVAGGAGAIVAAQIASLPTFVTVLGALAAGLGAILPVRSVVLRVGAKRRVGRMNDVIGDGMLLRSDDDVLRRLIAAHDAVEARVASSQLERDRRARQIGHAAMTEVAALLGGRLPATPAEREYIAARALAIEELGAALADPGLPPADHTERQALVDARREVEAIAGGSSVSEAADLVRDIRGDHDG